MALARDLADIHPDMVLDAGYPVPRAEQPW
jgi:hypothetical protein